MDERVRELLDRVRGTALTVSEAAGTTARYAAKCAGQTVDIAKLNMKIFDLKSDINNLLREVGQTVYDTHLGRTADQSALEEKLGQIDQKNRAIDELKDRIAALKHAKECPPAAPPAAGTTNSARAAAGPSESGGLRFPSIHAGRSPARLHPLQRRTTV